MPHAQSLTPGYRLNTDKVRRALCRLAATVVSFDRLGRSGEPLRRLRDEIANDEIAHLLVETALANRLQLEHMQQLRDDPTELSFPPFDETCGVFGWDEDAPSSQPLEFREACNKIVHADNVSVRCIEPETLYLEGRKGKDEWKVTIPIQSYIEISIKNFENAL